PPESSQYTEIRFEYADEPENIVCPPVEQINISAIQNLSQLQRQCVDLGRIIAYIQDNELPLDAKLARQTVYESESYFFKGDILYHKQQPANKNLQKNQPLLKQIAVPVGLRNEILRNYH